MNLPKDNLTLLNDFSSFLAESGLSSVSVKNYISDLRNFFSFLELNGNPDLYNLYLNISKYSKEYQNTLKDLFTPINTVNRRLASIRRLTTYLSIKYFSDSQVENHQIDQIASLLPKNLTNQSIETNQVASPTSSQKIIDQFSSYLKSEKKTHSTIKNYCSDLYHYFNWIAKHTPFNTHHLNQVLSKDQLTAYVSFLKLSQTTASVISRRQSSVKRLTSFCHKQGYIEVNPFEYVQPDTKLSPLSWLKRHLPKAKNPSSAPKNAFAKAYYNYHQLSFTPYLHLALLVIATTTMALLAYNQVIKNAKPSSAATSLTQPKRQLSFQGRLSDSAGTPIVTTVNVNFKLWDSLTLGSQLYTTGTCSVTPDNQGVFNSLIGDGVCGSEIPMSVFADNRDVYLEVGVGAETLTPRQQIATVGYALNSETLQGYPASSAATINTVPVIDNNGDINIAVASPSIISTSGNFSIVGQSLSLTTATNSGGDIVLQPDALGSGQILAIGGTTTEDTFRITNANLTSGSLLSGYIGNDVATGSGNLLLLSSGATETAKFRITADGRTTISTATVSADTAALTIDQNGTGDIFTGSASGVTKFNIGNSGNINTIDGVAHIIDDVTGNLTLTSNSNTISLNDNVTFAGTTTLNGQTYTWPASAGSNTFVLQTNGSGTLSWVAQTGGGVSFWDQANGTLYPLNSTVDFLLGGQATSSAKFAILNMDSGTPTATIAGTTANAALFYDGNGNISTTNRQSLVLGNSSSYDSTGDILLNPNGTGNIGIGTSTPNNIFEIYDAISGIRYQSLDNNGLYNVSLGYNAGLGNTQQKIVSLGYEAGMGATNAYNANFIGVDAGLNATNADKSNFIGHRAGDTATNANYANFIGRYAGFNATSAFNSNFIGANAGSGAPAANNSTFIGYAAGYNAINANGSLFLGNFSGYNDTVNNSIGGTSIAIGQYSGTGGFSDSIAIGRGVVNNAATELNIGNILYATNIYNSDTQSGSPVVGGNVGIGISSPAEKLDVAGNIKVSGTTTLNSQTYTWPGSAGSNGYVLQTNGSGTLSWVDVNTSIAAASLWQETNGTLFPKNSTVDFLIGGQATDSAKFAVLNMNSGVPVASVSSGIAGMSTYMTANGIIGTTIMQNLFIGSSATTGDIEIGNNTKLVSVNSGTWDITGAGIASGLTGLTSSGTINFSGLTPSTAVYTDGSSNLTSLAPTTGILGFWQRSSGALAPWFITDSINIGGTATSSALVHLAGTAGESSFFMEPLAIGFNSAITNPGLGGGLTALQVDGDILPGVDDDAYLGRANTAWSRLYLSNGINNSLGTEQISIVNRNLTGGRWNATSTFLVGGDEGDTMPSGIEFYTMGDASVSATFTAGGNSRIIGDLNIDGNVVIGGGAGKLDVGTVDPPYTINGEKYATYLSGMIGVKEETTGNIITNEYLENIGYRKTINFNNQAKGSDLWLFSKTTNLKENLSRMAVLLTPSSQAKTWYEIDENNNTLYIYSSAPGNISYRLSAPRFDSANWTNSRTSAYAGFILNDQGEDVTENNTDDNFNYSAQIENLDGQFALIINNQEKKDIGNFSSSLIANLRSGLAIVNELVVDNLTIKNKLVSPLATINELNAINATISGTLTADNIKGKTIDKLNEQLGILNDKYSTAAAILASIQENLNPPLQLSPLSTTSAQLPEELTNDSLTLQTLYTSDILASGSIFTQSLSSFDSDLFIQPTGDRPVHILANLLNLYPNGQVVIQGDLLITGNIFANNIDTRTATISGTLALGINNTQIATDSGKLLAVFGNQGEEVGSIDASGSANFNTLQTSGLVIASQNAFNSSVSGTITSNSTIGTASIATGSSEIFIQNNQVNPQTLIYITPISDTSNQVLFVKSKLSCTADINCTPGFTVAVPQTLDKETSFNYWLVQTK